MEKKKVLFKLDKKKFRANDFAKYMAKNYRGARREDPTIVVNKQYKN